MPVSMMAPTPVQRALSDLGAIATLAVPLLVNNLATAGMTTADTIMAGWLGASELAAVAVGANYVSFFYLAGLGMLMALSPTVAHAYGAGRNEDVARFMHQGLWLAAGISVLVFIGLSFAYPVLLALNVPEREADLAARYVHAVSFGIPGIFGFLALRFSSEGIGWTRPIMFTALVALCADIAGNYVFMYGKFGMPELGAVGCGVSTAIADWLVFLVIVVYIRRHRIYKPYRPLSRFEWPDFARLREILSLGLPISGSVLAEGGLFAAAGLMMGSFGATVMAGHAIAINYAALMFMVPLSLHSATTIHVGHRVGRGDPAAGRFAGWTGIALCGAVMLVSAAVLLIVRERIGALYTGDPAVLAIVMQLLVYVAAFQLADGLQVGAAGALRGFKDAKVPMGINLVSYWLVGFPLAYGFGVIYGLGAVAVWSGLIAGLSFSAVLLSLRYARVTSRAVSSQSRKP